MTIIGTLIRMALPGRQRCLVCNTRRDRHDDTACGPFFGLTECVDAHRHDHAQRLMNETPSTP